MIQIVGATALLIVSFIVAWFLRDKPKVRQITAGVAAVMYVAGFVLNDGYLNIAGAIVFLVFGWLINPMISPKQQQHSE